MNTIMVAPPTSLGTGQHKSTDHTALELTAQFEAMAAQERFEEWQMPLEASTQEGPPAVTGGEGENREAPVVHVVENTAVEGDEGEEDMATMVRKSTLQLKEQRSGREEASLASATSSDPHAAEGYRCEFVEEPPGGLQTDCLICQRVLREPHQVSCCGTNFCRACIDGVRSRAEKGFGACPSCVALADRYTVSHNATLQFTLSELLVYCPKACTWTGKLRDLDGHVSRCEEEEVETSPNEVAPSVVTVSHSGDQMNTFHCQYCGVALLRFEAEQHSKVCGSSLVQCPNNCGLKAKLQELNLHVERECPLTVVQCDFLYAGCRERQSRKDLPEHLANSVPAHLSLLAAHGFAAEAKLVQVKDELHQSQIKIKQLEKENRMLRDNVQRLDGYVTNIPPVKFEMSNFQRHITDLTEWYSPPFFSHPQGYMMCLKVNASGVGEARKHISVSIQLVSGEFDAYLTWPFLGVVSVQILNQFANRDHYLGKISFCTTSNSEITGRVTKAGLAPTALTRRKFISHSQLGYNSAKRTQYLKDDCLKFQIAKVENTNPLVQLTKQSLAMEPRVCIVPIAFTMTDFELHLQDDDHWYSPAFYTHLRGYRMCIGVCAKGKGQGTAVYVNVSAHIMRGHFDNSLKWPFRGSISIQMINQLQDKRHYTGVIDYTADTPDVSASQVLSGERAMGIGLDFISHADLDYNASTNCQYLKNDSVQFRVNKVTVKNN